MPRLYLTRTMASYDTLHTLTWSSTAGATEVTVFIHDGVRALRTYRNGVPIAETTNAPVLAAFSGGHLGIPFQSNNQNQSGDFALLLVYGRALSDTERVGIEAWAGARYGVAIEGSALEPDSNRHGLYLRQWIDAETLSATHTDHDPVVIWPARKGVSAQVPTATLPGGQSASPPTYRAAAIGGRPAVRFNGQGDFVHFPWFNMRSYVLQHVPDQNVRRAPVAIRHRFEDFQDESVRAFFQYVKEEINAYAGQPVPISANNVSGWEHPYDMFDFGLAEIRIDNARPGFLYARIREAAYDLGKAQLFTMPKPLDRTMTIQDWDTDYPELRTVTRKAIAFSYAAGGLMQVPWDHYMGGTYPRYFGDSADYAHLFKFVRDHPGFFEGYDDAFVTGYDLSDTRFGEVPPVEITGGSGLVSVTVRARAGDPDAPVVIHAVEWDHETPQPFTLTVNHSRFFGDEPHVITMHTHDNGTVEGFQYTADDQSTIVSVPALDTWAVLVVSKETFNVYTGVEGEGTITPDALIAKPLGYTTNFVVRAVDDDHHITGIDRNGEQVYLNAGHWGESEMSMAYVVTGEGHVEARIQPSTTVGGIELRWLESHGITDKSDQVEDMSWIPEKAARGHTIMMDWLADTDPNDPGSWFELSVESAGPHVAIILPSTSSNRVYALEESHALTEPVDEWRRFIHFTGSGGAETGNAIPSSDNARAFFRGKVGVTPADVGVSPEAMNGQSSAGVEDD